jgi:hypothetical protein
MTREFHRQAETRCSELATEAAEQFDSTLLHNRVHETVDGQHDREHDLLVALDLAERAHDLSDQADSDALDDQAFAAAQHLEHPVDDLVDEAVARACRDILVEGGDWTDTWDEREVHDAQGEAMDWVGDNPAACDRAGVLEAVQDIEVDDLVGVETHA